MLRWALIFLVVAIVSAFFGLTDVASASAGIAKVLFAIFLIGFLIFVVAGVVLGRRITR